MAYLWKIICVWSQICIFLQLKLIWNFYHKIVKKGYHFLRILHLIFIVFIVYCNLSLLNLASRWWRWRLWWRIRRGIILLQLVLLFSHSLFFFCSPPPSPQKKHLQFQEKCEIAQFLERILCQWWKCLGNFPGWRKKLKLLANELLYRVVVGKEKPAILQKKKQKILLKYKKISFNSNHMCVFLFLVYYHGRSQKYDICWTKKLHQIGWFRSSKICNEEKPITSPPRCYWRSCLNENN